MKENNMAQSTCPKCDNQKFELKENTPQGSLFKLGFIQCTQCGAVVGVTEWYNVPGLINDLAGMVKKLGKKMNVDL